MIDTGAMNVGGRRNAGSSGGGGGGGVSQQWVDENYISKAFFARLFTIHSTTVTQDDPNGEVVEPNDLETEIASIQSMVGHWTEQYLSALGQGSGGGGGGGAILTEPLASINEAGLGTPSGSNKVIAWNGSGWEYKTFGSGSGTVTSIGAGTGLSSSTGGAITTSGTLSISSDYQTKISHGETAYGWGNHANAGYLTASSSVITTLQSYFDVSGNANSALKLTTVSKKAWGKTYWTANGVPDSISGNMTNVGNISFSDTGKNIGSVAYFDTTNHRLGIGSAPGAYKLDVNGDIRTSGNLYIGGTNRILSGGGDSAKNLLEFDGTQVTLAYGFRASNETRIYGQNISMYHGSTLKVQVTSTGLKIGDATLSWDSTNHALKIDTGFYSESFISALGAGSGGSTQGITMADVWDALATPAPSSSQQQIEASHITGALSTCVRTTGNQTITGNKTLYNAIVTSNFGAKFESICIACDTSGFVGTHSGEINRFSGDLHLQYDGSYGVTMFNKLRFSMASGNTYLTSNGAYFTLTVGSASHALIDYAWVVTSDMRRKDVIMNAGASIEQIADAPIFYYRLKGSPETTLALGSSAQYWQQVFPNAISETPDGFLSMDYSAISLASAVMTARKVMTHEERIKALEKENKELRKQIETLKAS